MSLSGSQLHQQAEIYYSQQNIPQAFEFYRLAINKIIRNEDVTVTLASAGILLSPPESPQQLLYMIWTSFVGFFIDRQMNFTQETAPEAYKLLYSFRACSNKDHRRFTSQQGQTILKAMQISAALGLSVLAWDKTDRSTASKRYQEALDVAATHQPFLTDSPNSTSLERRVTKDVRQIRHNLEILKNMDNDRAKVMDDSGREHGNRKEVVEMQNLRLEKDGRIRVQESVVSATDGCNNCGKREVNLRKRSSCGLVRYCDNVCQRALWRRDQVSAARHQRIMDFDALLISRR